MSVQVAVRGLLTIVVIALLSALWLWQCTGPHPVVTNVRLEEPQQAGDPYTVLATLDNDRWSHGTVTVTFEIVDRRTGEVYREARRVEILEDDERLNVSADISAPEADYEPRVKAQHPPNG